MKFLGLVYNGQEDTLRGATRKGSKLIMDKHELVAELEKFTYGKRGAARSK